MQGFMTGVPCKEVMIHDRTRSICLLWALSYGISQSDDFGTKMVLLSYPLGLILITYNIIQAA